jgi:hypothetical protein
VGSVSGIVVGDPNDNEVDSMSTSTNGQVGRRDLSLL